MNTFLEKLLKHKKVAVWGSGYLSYTTLLLLQSRGYRAVVYDFSKEQHRAIKEGDYPKPEQVAAWTSTGNIPRIKFEFINIADHPKEMFKEDICMHIVGFPYSDRDKPEHGLLVLNKTFKAYAGKPKNTPPVIFLSAGSPGELENFFAKDFAKYQIATVFRNDWTIEEFMSNRSVRPVSGNCVKAIEKTEKFLDLFGIKHVRLKSIKEAEIYENARNTIYYLISTTMNQLAFSYPNVDFREMSRLLLSNIDISMCSLKIGIGGHRMPFAVEKLLEGSLYSNFLSLLKEAQAVNSSSIISYAEFLARKGYDSVALLGLSSEGNIKDPALSPTISLAELILKHGLKVGVHDPFFTKEEIKKSVLGATPINSLRELSKYQAVIVMNDHDIYKFLTQKDIDSYINEKVSIVIDNTGIWSAFQFSKNTVYHAVGDGSFNIMK